MTAEDYVFPANFTDNMAEYGYKVEALDGCEAGTVWVMITRGPLGCTCKINENKLKSESELLDALKAAVLAKAAEYARLNNEVEASRDGFLEWQITLLNDLHLISGDAIIHVLSGTVEIISRFDYDKPTTPQCMKFWLNDSDN